MILYTELQRRIISYPVTVGIRHFSDMSLVEAYEVIPGGQTCCWLLYHINVDWLLHMVPKSKHNLFLVLTAKICPTNLVSGSTTVCFVDPETTC